MQGIETSRAVQFNSQAVEHISNRNYHDALLLLVKGLRVAQSDIEKQGFEPLINNNMAMAIDDDNAGSSCQYYFNVTGLSDNNNLVDNTTTSSSSSPLSSSCNKSCIFPYPAQFVKLGETSNAEISLVLIYNMALAHHLMAIAKTNDSCFENYQKALELYELAFRLQENENLQISALHSMALVNNLGQAHQQLQNNQEAKKCMEHLLSILMWFVEQDRVEGISATQEENQYLEIFFQNTTPLVLRGSSMAPAA